MSLPDPAPGFDDPLGLLAACHERILRQCALLERLVPHVRAQGADAEARKAAGTVLHYFATAARHHHDDEEEDLFPLLRREPALKALIGQLAAEHMLLEGLWMRLREHLGEPGLGDAAALEAAVTAFAQAYRAHIASENTALLPRARVLLSVAELKELGRSMAERRGVALAE